jgi:hypothetical protein
MTLVQEGPDERNKVQVYRNRPYIYGTVGKLKKIKKYRALMSFLALKVMKWLSHALDQPSRG